MKMPTSACGGENDVAVARMERSDIRDDQARMIGCGRNTLRAQLLLAGNIAQRRTWMSLRSIRATPRCLKPIRAADSVGSPPPLWVAKWQPYRAWPC
jgi:hypothetical protein